MDPEQIVRDMEARMEPMQLGGVFNTLLWLSPSDVSSTKSLPFWEPRSTHKFNARQGCIELRSQKWRSASGDEYSLGVFQGGLNFPSICPVNLEAPTHYEVVEFPINRGQMPTSKLRFDMPQEQANRTVVALSCDRYWFAIPFSDGHGKDDKAVNFSGGFSGADEVQFANREYAQRFGELNHLKRGKWQAARHRIMVVAGFICLTMFGGLVISSGLIWMENAKSGNWGHLNPAIVVINTLIGLVGLGAGIYLLVKGIRGEPL